MHNLLNCLAILMLLLCKSGKNSFPIKKKRPEKQFTKFQIEKLSIKNMQICNLVTELLINCFISL